MKQLQPWAAFEKDMTIAMILVADGMMNMLGHGPRAQSAAEAFLGIKIPADFSGFLVTEATDGAGNEEAFLASIDITGTNFYRAVRRGYTTLTKLAPLHEVQYQDERDEAFDWLGYFLSAVPTDSYGSGDDFSGLVYDPQRPLPLLYELGGSYLYLVEFVHRTLGAGSQWGNNADRIVFNADDLARLANVDVRSVRNAMGPTGSKPIRSFKALPSDNDEERAYADPVDALDWLSGRRSFRCGRLEAEWVNNEIPKTESLEALGAIAGMMFWLNGSTTEAMAAELAWDVDTARKWTRGIGLDPLLAKRVASAAGIDPVAYSRKIQKLMKKED
jgi:hypothetical protein